MTRASDTAKLLGAGATILDGTTISTADNTAQVTLVSTDADATSGPLLHFQRNSSSPANSDNMGRILFDGKNNADEDTTYVEFQLTASDVTDGSEDASFQIGSKTAGSFLSRVEILPTETVFNEDSGDVDFRVESNGGTHAFVVEGGTDNVGIMNSNSSTLTAAKFNVELAGVAITGDTDGATMGDTGICQLYNSNNGTTNSTVMLLGGTSVGVPAQIASGIGFTRENNGNWGTQLRFYTHETDTSDVDALRERLRLDSSGNVHVATTDTDLSNNTSGGGHNILASGQYVMASEGNNMFYMNLTGYSSGTQNYFVFLSDGNTKGTIGFNGSNTVYATSSDYRLKENVVTEWDATTRLKQLKPSRFNFIANPDTTVDGFLAHEVSSIIPEAVIGEKDAMTEEVLYVDGDEIPDGKNVGDVKVASKIDPQGIDQSKLVPLLVKTIQELEARITTLENA